MRKAFLISVWVMGFSYALQLLVLGNSGVLAYGKAMEIYDKMERNVTKLSLKSLETESKLAFLKSTIAGNVAHELGYFQSGEKAIFPVISEAIPDNEIMPLVTFKRSDTNQSGLKSFQISCIIALLSFCLSLVYSALIKNKSRKNQCNFVQTASRT